LLIKITLRNYRGYTSDSPAEFTLGPGFSAFVGRNNAGKSTCLRAIYELREAFQHLKVWRGENSNSSINIESEPDISAVLNFDNPGPAYITIEISPTTAFTQHARLTKSTISLFASGRIEPTSIEISLPSGEIVRPNLQNSTIREIKLGAGQGFEFKKQGETSFTVESFHFDNALSDLARAVYFGPYRNAINEGSSRHYDIAVGTGLIQEWDYWKAGNSVDYRKAISRVESDIERLLGYQSLQINASSDNKTLNINVDKHPYKLADLGAGVAELIITLATALVKKPSFILIDEPESHLHPSLQVDFLTTLASYAEYGIAFSTHSIGLARSLADRIYAVIKRENKSQCIVYEKQAHLAELLGNLSYSGYFPSENAYVLLVEGSTEVKVFQVLLRKLKKDHSFVILPLGGSQLIGENRANEIAEVIRIAGGADKVYAVVDSEQAGADAPLAKERAAFKDTCNKLGIKCLITSRRATENYFSQNAIQNALGKSYTALSEYELLKNSQNGWAKSDNWKIAAAESDLFFNSHDLGKFLAELPSQ
jgi:ABC-type cobalamin/Fe3+-siderophores transport system ATPase subunit